MRELQNKSPEALELIRNRITFYYVPKHLIGKALGFERIRKEQEKKNLTTKKENQQQQE